jgi:hypothetical protein
MCTRWPAPSGAMTGRTTPRGDTTTGARTPASDGADGGGGVVVVATVVAVVVVATVVAANASNWGSSDLLEQAASVRHATKKSRRRRTVSSTYPYAIRFLAGCEPQAFDSSSQLRGGRGEFERTLGQRPQYDTKVV